MKLTLKAIIAALGLGLTISGASAATYNEVINHNQKINTLQSVGGTFDISDNGYSSASETITSAVAKFYLQDDGDASGELAVVHIGAGLLPDNGFGVLAGTWSVVLGNQIVGSLLADLAADGKLTYVITSLAKDFWVKKATLDVTTRSVPDSATTLALFGASLLGLVAFRRMFA